MPYCVCTLLYFLEAGEPLSSSLDYLCSLKSKQDFLSNIFYYQRENFYYNDENSSTLVCPCRRYSEMASSLINQIKQVNFIACKLQASGGTWHLIQATTKQLYIQTCASDKLPITFLQNGSYEAEIHLISELFLLAALQTIRFMSA